MADHSLTHISSMFKYANLLTDYMKEYTVSCIISQVCFLSQKQTCYNSNNLPFSSKAQKSSHNESVNQAIFQLQDTYVFIDTKSTQDSTDRVSLEYNLYLAAGFRYIFQLIPFISLCLINTGQHFPQRTYRVLITVFSLWFFSSLLFMYW